MRALVRCTAKLYVIVGLAQIHALPFCRIPEPSQPAPLAGPIRPYALLSIIERST